MYRHHPTLVVLLITALIASGCQTAPAIVTGSRPTQTSVNRKVPTAEVFELVRWQPITPSTSTTTAPVKPTRQFPVELQRRYLDQGQTLGFAKQDGQLIAVAGAATQPLLTTHYTWQTLPGEFHHMDQLVAAPVEDGGGNEVGQFMVDFLGALIDNSIDNFFNPDATNGSMRYEKYRQPCEHRRERSHDNHPPTQHKKPTSKPTGTSAPAA